jgi:hypothetical protein
VTFPESTHLYVEFVQERAKESTSAWKATNTCTLLTKQSQLYGKVTAKRTRKPRGLSQNPSRYMREQSGEKENTERMLKATNTRGGGF